MKREIRFEAIGGQGAHSAGKILAEAAVLGMGFTGNHFSSFGSEKRGSPVRSSVRYRDDGRPVRSVSPIERPDCLAIFHENLLVFHPSCMDGTHEGMVLVVNSPRLPEELSLPPHFRAKEVATVDALAIARELGAGVSAVMLGVVSRYCPEITQEAIAGSFRAYFGKRRPEAVDRNLRAMEVGRRRARAYGLSPGARGQSAVETRRLPPMGYQNAPIGGVIVNPGNTVLRNLSHSRKGTVPALDYERCIHCGRCDMVCPDYCFVWKQMPPETAIVTLPSGDTPVAVGSAGVPLLQGIDYSYCKGCQKCIEACPTGALELKKDTERVRERSHFPRFHEKPGELDAFPVFSEVDEDP